MFRSSDRRGFFGAWLGVVSAFVLGRGRASAMVQTAESRLKELGITLPAPPAPIATYVRAVRVGNLLFVSGHGPAAAPDGKTLRGEGGPGPDDRGGPRRGTDWSASTCSQRARARSEASTAWCAW